MVKIFKPNDKVTFDDDPTGEILIVKQSRFHRTQVETLDGIDISHNTQNLSIAVLPLAMV